MRDREREREKEMINKTRAFKSSTQFESIRRQGVGRLKPPTGEWSTEEAVTLAKLHEYLVRKKWITEKPNLEFHDLIAEKIRYKKKIKIIVETSFTESETSRGSSDDLSFVRRRNIKKKHKIRK